MLCLVKYSFDAYAAVVENQILELRSQLEDGQEFSQKQTLQLRNIILKMSDSVRFESIYSIKLSTMPMGLNIYKNVRISNKNGFYAQKHINEFHHNRLQLKLSTDFY